MTVRNLAPRRVATHTAPGAQYPAYLIWTAQLSIALNGLLTGDAVVLVPLSLLRELHQLYFTDTSPDT